MPCNSLGQKPKNCQDDVHLKMVIVDIPIRAFKVKNNAVSATFFSP